jgi:preprotein translocase SecE subunit
VARDRKRAKQRRARAGARGTGAAAPETGPVRADVPGSLDHASADVDEFDAALVRGAGGVTEEDADEDGGGLELLEPDAPSGGSPPAAPPTGVDELDGDGAPPRPSGAAPRGGNRAVGFLAASWAELQRVQWPDRRQVTQATAVVLGFVAIAGVYLGVADFVAKEIVEQIL